MISYTPFLCRSLNRRDEMRPTALDQLAWISERMACVASENVAPLIDPRDVLGRPIRDGERYELLHAHPCLKEPRAFVGVWRKRGATDIGALEEAIAYARGSGSTLLLCQTHQADNHIVSLLNGNVSWSFVHPPGHVRNHVKKEWNTKGFITDDLEKALKRIANECKSYLRKARETRRLLFCLLNQYPKPILFSPLPQCDGCSLTLYGNGTNAIVASSFLASVRNAKFGQKANYILFPCDGFRFCWPRNETGRCFYHYHAPNYETPAWIISGEDYVRHLTINSPEAWWHDFADWDLSGALASTREVFIHSAPVWAASVDLLPAVCQFLGWEPDVSSQLDMSERAALLRAKAERVADKERGKEDVEWLKANGGWEEEV